ncbi:hypothetical protein D3C87_1561860 [compost metagenome]
MAPFRAAPVSTSPRIGPAQGAHKRPVAMPSIREPATVGIAPGLPAALASRLPSSTTGRVMMLAARGETSPTPKTASSARAASRPYSLALIAQLPPTAASVATAQKVAAIPVSRGSVLRRNGCPARAKTKGRMGRIQGLRIVSAPPR